MLSNEELRELWAALERLADQDEDKSRRGGADTLTARKRV